MNDDLADLIDEASTIQHATDDIRDALFVMERLAEKAWAAVSATRRGECPACGMARADCQKLWREDPQRQCCPDCAHKLRPHEAPPAGDDR